MPVWSQRICFRVVVASLCWLACAPGLAFAQSTTLTPMNGGGLMRAETQYAECGWALDKSDPFWGDLRVWFTGNRQYAQDESITPETTQQIVIRLKGDFLPSQSIICDAFASVEMGILMAPSGFSYTVNWSNPSCNDFPQLRFTRYDNLTYWIDETLWNLGKAGSVDTGALYWHSVASDLTYSGLQVTGGGDVGVVASYTLGAFTIGLYDPNSRTISLNMSDFPSWSDDAWAFVAAHEFGHALGLDHSASSDPDQTIMVQQETGRYEGLLPRTLDKCAAVYHWPVDIAQ